MAVSICHCTTCQRLLGAPFGIQSMHKADAVECNAPREELWSLETSKMVTRYRCPDCASPVYASLRNGKLIVVPRSMLFQNDDDKKDTAASDKDDAYKPTHHMYYASRIVDVNDNLPKYVGTSQPGRGVLWTLDKDVAT